MIDEIAQAELILILNSDLEQSNSGVALVALSLDRPIATRRVCVTEHLAEEMGPGWVVFLEDGELDGSKLHAALEEARHARTSATPALRGRDWATVARRYADVFESMLSPHMDVQSEIGAQDR
ncbi:hypothetical protein [Gordonia amicalis]|uniref:hypothetical protein n=1 Tax=Gordonia amicalis TaxID=89053 RepID=UPI00387DBFAD